MPTRPTAFTALKALAAASLIASLPASATPIIMAGSGTQATAFAFDNAEGTLFAVGSVSPTGLGSGSVTRTAGTSSATTAYDYGVSGGDVTLAHTFNQHAAGENPATIPAIGFEQSGSSYGSVTFTLEAGDIGYTYSVDGRLEQEGTSRIRILSSLEDVTTGFSLYMDQGEYFPSTDAYLQTGETHASSGPLTGALIAGHTYRFNYNAFNQQWTTGSGAYTNPYGFTPTDVQGHLTLTLSGPAAPVDAVPEPGTLALFGLGISALAFACRRRKSM